MRVPWRQGNAQTLLLQQANVPGPAGELTGYLTRPVSPAGPICGNFRMVELMSEDGCLRG
jgi:hypothetical protein